MYIQSLLIIANIKLNRFIFQNQCNYDLHNHMTILKQKLIIKKINIVLWLIFL